jgi:hypothetical protein
MGNDKSSKRVGYKIVFLKKHIRIPTKAKIHY